MSPQPRITRERDGLSTAAHVEFAENCSDVIACGLLSDPELCRDLAIVNAVGKYVENLALARGKPV